MNLNWDRAIKNIPERIRSLFEMRNPNVPILLYEGIFYLTSNEIRKKFQGTIMFRWSPILGISFTGISLTDNDHDINHFHISEDKKYLEVEGGSLGECFITRSTSKGYVRGVMAEDAIMGDTETKIKEVVFCIPNMRDIRGNRVKLTTTENVRFESGRIELKNSKSTITIDKRIGFNDLRESLVQQGGHLILYDGVIRKVKGELTFEESRIELWILSLFLSFVNGRKIGLNLRAGISDSEKIWFDFGAYQCHHYKSSTSWLPLVDHEQISVLWNSYSRLYRRNKDFATKVVLWYLESNNSDSNLDSRIIIGQSALELIFYWWIFEQKRVILGDDIKKISAASKIRLILSYCSINLETPINLIHLSRLNKDDGALAITRVRNDIVHNKGPEPKKGEPQITNLVKEDAATLTVYYIEMALLKILGYNGKIRSRVLDVSKLISTEIQVPWKQ